MNALRHAFGWYLIKLPSGWRKTDALENLRAKSALIKQNMVFTDVRFNIEIMALEKEHLRRRLVFREDIDKIVLSFLKTLSIDNNGHWVTKM